MNDILDRSPWSFDKRLVMMKQFTNDVSPENVTFQRSPFWIRVFNIPIKSMNATVGNYIANEIGVPILVDAPKSGLAWGPFLRIRVDVDITKPLMRGKMIQIEGMEKGWVYFKYERLPIYCYRCGILGHQERECQKIKRGCFTVDEDDVQFGPWLRVKGPIVKWGNSPVNKTKNGEAETDFDSESEEENEGRTAAQDRRQYQRAAPTRKTPDETRPATSVDDLAETSGCQVNPRSQTLPVFSKTQQPTPLSLQKSQKNPERVPPNTEENTQNPKLNPLKADTHSPNTEKSSSLSDLNTNMIDKPAHRNLERSSSITALPSENRVPYPMEKESHKHQPIQVSPDPQNIGNVEILSIPKDSSTKSTETGVENLNTESLVEDTEMELNRDCSEDISVHTKTNLRSWKRVLRKSSSKPTPTESEEVLCQTHIKRTNSNSSSVEYPRPKKLAIERLVGGTPSPCQPP